MVLERGHYSPVAIDDAFSKKVYAKYLDNKDFKKNLIRFDNKTNGSNDSDRAKFVEKLETNFIKMSE